jgi:hypothetical protein
MVIGFLPDVARSFCRFAQNVRELSRQVESRHSGMRLFGAGPESRAALNVWIPGSREGARPGMTALGFSRPRSTAY